MTKHFNLADMFELVAGAIPDRQALVCGDARLTFGELNARANKLAHYFQSLGIGQNDHVGLYLYNCNEYLEAMFACFKLRAVPINVNYRYVGEELLYIFDNADMKAVVHHREFIPAISELQNKGLDVFDKLQHFVCVDDEFEHDLASTGSVAYEAALEGQSDQDDYGERSGEDLFILYTGGTTGFPKGVMWPHEALFYAALGGAGHFHPDGPLKKPEDIVRCKDSEMIMSGMPLAPMMHGASWWYACIQLFSGNSLVLNPNHKFEGEQIWRLVAQERVSSIQIVGDAMAIPLLDALPNVKDELDLSCLFHVGSGGAVFSESKQQAFKEHFPNAFIINAFGSSESGNMGLDSGNKKTESGLGNVAKDEFMDVIVVEEDSYRHAKNGETGIFARSGYIPFGYYNDPEKTAKTFVEVEGKRWLLTGDESILEDDDTITVFGRGSNCINSGGEKIFPEEVEQALKAHPDIFDALVVATPDERWGSLVTAVVSVREGSSVSLDGIQEEARKLIAGYKLPRELHIADEIRRAPSGKPDYKWALDYALSKEGQAAS